MSTIHSRCARRFINPKTGEVFKVPHGHIGQIPDWVLAETYFQSCCKDGSITLYMGDGTPSDVLLAKNSEEAALLQEFRAAKSLREAAPTDDEPATVEEVIERPKTKADK